MDAITWVQVTCLEGWLHAPAQLTAKQDMKSIDSVCPRWSLSFGREVNGSNPRCCALQRATSRLNSVNGYQECQNEPTDQRGPVKHQIHDTYSMWEIGMEFRGVALRECSLLNGGIFNEHCIKHLRSYLYYGKLFEHVIEIGRLACVRAGNCKTWAVLLWILGLLGKK